MPSDHPAAALVTGGSRGIGWACAAGLANQGYRTVITGRDPERLEKAIGRSGWRTVA